MTIATNYFVAAPARHGVTAPASAFFPFEDGDAESTRQAWVRCLDAVMSSHGGRRAVVWRSPRCRGPWDGARVVFVGDVSGMVGDGLRAAFASS